MIKLLLFYMTVSSWGVATDWFSCENHKDCVEVSADGCCPKKAVNKKLKKAYLASHENVHADELCIDSQGEKASLTPRCVKGSCIMKALK